MIDAIFLSAPVPVRQTYHPAGLTSGTPAPLPARPRVPARPPFQVEVAAAEAPLAAGTAPRKRVLVVDNEVTSTRMVRLTLERSGLFDICEVNDPLTALATARRFQPNLVLLDIEMPGLDGSGVARQLREDKALRNVPILFMTSLITPEEADHQLYAAGSRVLAKPVTISKLMQSVAEMLSNILVSGTPDHPADPAR